MQYMTNADKKQIKQRLQDSTIHVFDRLVALNAVIEADIGTKEYAELYEPMLLQCNHHFDQLLYQSVDLPRIEPKDKPEDLA